MTIIVLILFTTVVTHVEATVFPRDVDAFVAQYWQRPLAAQGQPPANLTVLESSLQPTQCGTCHPRQFDGWHRSHHARALGPGVLGQVLTLSAAAAQECLDCHAPLQEQAAALIGQSSDNHSLSKQGVICSACHLRNYQWFGPPARPDKSPSTSTLSHNGWHTHAAFTDSHFCAACHQFGEGDYQLNGKLLENTYQEWQASPQAQRQQQCQSCHMPDRQHRWRGIHDPEMVRTGVTIDVSQIDYIDNLIKVSLSLKNTGVGHFFPTYVTPSIILEIYQEDAQQHRLTDTAQQVIIARYVSLDLQIEFFDTRLAPNATATLSYCQPLHAAAKNLVIRVQVEPDAFYRRFYENLLAGTLAAESVSLIQEALANAKQSVFTLYSERLTLEKLKAELSD